MLRYSNGATTRIMGLSSLFQTQKNSRNNLQKNTIISSRTAAKKGRRDEYIRGSVSSMFTYSRNLIKNHSPKCSDAVMDTINFHYMDICRKRGNKEHCIIVDDVEYLKKYLPKIDSRRCENITAINNKVVLNNGKYYKYCDGSGKEHIFSCVDNKLQQPYTDQEAHRQDKATYNISKFWNMLSKDGTYMGLYYPESEQRKYLNDAGIKEGFFSVQVGSRKQEYFLSNGNAGVAVRKFEYDATYEMYRRGSALFNEYPVGSIFTIAGKEYALKEDRTLDIPYGEDIFDVQFPKGGKSHYI